MYVREIMVYAFEDRLSTCEIFITCLIWDTELAVQQGYKVTCLYTLSVICVINLFVVAVLMGTSICKCREEAYNSKQVLPFSPFLFALLPCVSRAIWFWSSKHAYLDSPKCQMIYEELQNIFIVYLLWPLT